MLRSRWAWWTRSTCCFVDRVASQVLCLCWGNHCTCMNWRYNGHGAIFDWLCVLYISFKTCCRMLLLYLGYKVNLSVGYHSDFTALGRKTGMGPKTEGQGFCHPEATHETNGMKRSRTFSIVQDGGHRKSFLSFFALTFTSVFDFDFDSHFLTKTHSSNHFVTLTHLPSTSLVHTSAAHSVNPKVTAHPTRSPPRYIDMSWGTAYSHPLFSALHRLQITCGNAKPITCCTVP